jgi:methionine synthase II (cobalamin-independent)
VESIKVVGQDQVDQTVFIQEEASLEIVTDGEIRRQRFRPK